MAQSALAHCKRVSTQQAIRKNGVGIMQSMMTTASRKASQYCNEALKNNSSASMKKCAYKEKIQ